MRCPAYLSLFKNLLRIIGAALLVAGLQGCGALRLAYNQAPLATYWYLDDYIDFNAAQRSLMKTALNDIHDWHRQTQLPLYIETLQKLQSHMPTDISATQACDLYAEVQERLLVSFEGMAGRLTMGQASGMQVIVSLDTAQLSHLEKKFAKNNAKYRKDFVDGPAAKMHEKRLDQAISRAEMLYGNLTHKQEALLDARLDESGFDGNTAYAERLRRQQDLLQTLRLLTRTPASTMPTHMDAPNAANSLVSVLTNMAISPDLSYRNYSQKTRLQFCQTFADLHNSMSPEQRLKALDKLRGYEQDLRVLMRQP